jgi:predicted amidohydrolase
MTGAALNVAVIQHDIFWEDRSATLSHLTALINDAAERGARLVVLTEMFSVGFSAETARIEEPPDGPSTEFLREAALRHGLWILGSICVRSPSVPLPQNVAVLASPGGELFRYAKRHLFSYSGEHRRIAPGHETLTVDIDGARISVFVCYDLRFADEFWRLAPKTDAYVLVANWPAARAEHWRSLLVARAIENQAWVIGSNRVGDGGGIHYQGDSLIVDPLGVVVADGAGRGETVLTALVDPTRVAEVRSRYPFLDDRNGPVPLDADES